MAAKEALIGYAAASATRPGQLPCPDMNNDGFAEAADTGLNGCPSGNVGRLPWRTLGLEDMREGAGERLWYAVAPDFARAVIFAPGATLPAQLRDGANANNPANYLDTTAGVSNAAISSFISAASWDTLPPSPPPSPFNDRLVIIDTAQLWTVVEKRIAREMLALLKRYRDTSACNCYPWAANDFDDDSVTGRESGMVPIENALPETWSSLGITVPSYMIGSNEWGKRFFYTVASNQTEYHTAGTLTADGVANKDLVVITPGPAGASRPSTNLSDYIEDAENRDHGVIFVTPLSTEYARDRIYICPGAPGIC